MTRAVAFCLRCLQDMADPTTTGCLLDHDEIGVPYDGLARCRDCATTAGSFHHLFCCIERCPVCTGLVLSCDCGDEL